MAGWMKGGEVKDDRKRETKEEERTNKKSGNQNRKVEKEKEGGWMDGGIGGGATRGDYGMDGEAGGMNGRIGREVKCL